MREYRHVVQFYYKNNMYNMYLDNKNIFNKDCYSSNLNRI